MLRIGGIDHGFVVPAHPIAHGSIGMIELPCFNDNVPIHSDAVAGVYITEINFRLDFSLHKGSTILKNALGEVFRHRFPGVGVGTVDGDVAVFTEDRRKKGYPLDVVPMVMGEEHKAPERIPWL